MMKIADGITRPNSQRYLFLSCQDSVEPSRTVKVLAPAISSLLAHPLQRPYLCKRLQKARICKRGCQGSSASVGQLQVRSVDLAVVVAARLATGEGGHQGDQ